jgi:hypothetical protein
MDYNNCRSYANCASFFILFAILCEAIILPGFRSASTLHRMGMRLNDKLTDDTSPQLSGKTVACVVVVDLAKDPLAAQDL